jgi:hypothetical protein
MFFHIIDNFRLLQIDEGTKLENLQLEEISIETFLNLSSARQSKQAACFTQNIIINLKMYDKALKYIYLLPI